MDSSRLPEPLRSRAEELDRLPPLEHVKRLLRFRVGAMGSFDEIRAEMRKTAAHATRRLMQELTHLDALLAQPQPPGLLTHLVAYEANWVLDNPSDQASAAFLRQIADLLREVLAETEQRRPEAQ